MAASKTKTASKKAAKNPTDNATKNAQRGGDRQPWSSASPSRTKTCRRRLSHDRAGARRTGEIRRRDHRRPSRPGRTHCRSCRSISARSTISRPGRAACAKNSARSTLSSTMPWQLGLSGTLALMHHSKIDEMVRLNTLSPIVLTKYVLRGMMADGSRTHRQRRLDRRVHRRGQRRRLCGDQGVHGRLHPLARPRVGPLGITVNAVAPGILETDAVPGC